MNTKLICRQVVFYDKQNHRHVDYILSKDYDSALEKINEETGLYEFFNLDLNFERDSYPSFYVYKFIHKIDAIRAANQIGDLLSHEYKIRMP